MLWHLTTTIFQLFILIVEYSNIVCYGSNHCIGAQNDSASSYVMNSYQCDLFSVQISRGPELMFHYVYIKNAWRSTYSSAWNSLSCPKLRCPLRSLPRSNVPSPAVCRILWCSPFWTRMGAKFTAMVATFVASVSALCGVSCFERVNQ